MKIKHLLFLAIITIIVPWNSYCISLSIKVVFEPGFHDAFADGQPWQYVDEDDVKDFIIQRMTEDFSSYNIPVSTSSGNLVVGFGIGGAPGQFGTIHVGMEAI